MTNNGFYDHEQIPTNTTPELHAARKLGEHLEFLREQVRQTEEAWVEAWKKVPHDPEINKRPWRSDIASKCRNCGLPTKWVHPKGYAAHFNKDLVLECPPDKLGRTTVSIPQDVWDAFDALDDDTGETLEFITRGPSRPVEVESIKEDTKPSEREV